MADDNARKFIVRKIDQKFLLKYNASSSGLVIDWTDIGEDTESKVVREAPTEGAVRFFFITKKSHGGTRTSEKKEINEAEYNELLQSSLTRIVKTRYRFDISQDGRSFSLRYDKFSSNKFMLEVDALSGEKIKLFQPEAFPYTLQEVTGDKNYYGHRFGA